mmetsp:Transcript_92753/g.248064  ORF Transcript_92753/g.248064 Transcript_92753/m.248064 type:complete len:562 (+) Transcript_92753:562-2247(+)
MVSRRRGLWKRTARMATSHGKQSAIMMVAYCRSGPTQPEFQALRDAVIQAVANFHESDHASSPAEDCFLGTLSLRLVLLAEMEQERAAQLIAAGFLKKQFQLFLQIPFAGILLLNWPVFALLRNLSERAWEFLPKSRCDADHSCTFGDALATFDSARLQFGTASSPSNFNRTVDLIHAGQRSLMRMFSADRGILDFLRTKWNIWSALHRLREVLDGDRFSDGPASWLLGLPSAPWDVQDVMLSNQASDLYVRYFIDHVRSEFYGATDAVELFVKDVALHDDDRRLSSSGRWVFMDIGAAFFDGDCLVVDMIRHFGCAAGDHGASVLVMAFEPLKENFEALVSHLTESLDSASLAACVQVHRVAVGNRTGQTSIFGRGRLASAVYHDLRRNDMDDAIPTEVAMVSVDDVFIEEDLEHIDILKIDTEGNDWNVIDGARDVIEGGLVGSVIVEYGGFWSRHTWEVSNLASVPRQQEELMWPNLKGVVQWFWERGYEGYFMGTRQLIPIYGQFWHDWYEVCRAPHHVMYRGIFGWCWFDVVFVRASSDLGRRLRRSALAFLYELM